VCCDGMGMGMDISSAALPCSVAELLVGGGVCIA
jgi:hypothetical protein